MKGAPYNIDYSLYLVTDRPLAAGRDLTEIVREAALGGATIIQLREKDAGTRDFLAIAQSLKTITLHFRIPLIINDRVDIAMACGADGVHLGQEDMQCGTARKLVGNRMKIGVSVARVDEAVQAESEGADYLGAGPVFSTMTKPDTTGPIGLEGVKRIREAVSIPVVAIGGIDWRNAADVIESGADGIAVVSAIVASPSVRETTAVLRQIVDRAKSGRPVPQNP